MERTKTVQVVLCFSKNKPEHLLFDFPFNLRALVYEAFTDAISQCKRSHSDCGRYDMRIDDGLDALQKINAFVSKIGGSCTVVLSCYRASGANETEMPAGVFLKEYEVRGEQFFVDLLEKGRQKLEARRRKLRQRKN